MEFKETFIKAGELYVSLSKPENRKKVYVAFAIIYTIIISLIVFISSLSLFNFISLNYKQKATISVIVLSFATYIYYSVNWVAVGNILSKVRSILIYSLNTMDKSVKTSKSTSSYAVRINNSLFITYVYHGTEHTIYIPYSDKNMNIYSDVKVFAEIIKDGSSQDIDITQQSGLPYFISPSDIDAYKIYSTNSQGTILSEVYGTDILTIRQQELPFSE